MIISKFCNNSTESHQMPSWISIQLKPMSSNLHWPKSAISQSPKSFHTYVVVANVHSVVSKRNPKSVLQMAPTAVLRPMAIPLPISLEIRSSKIFIRPALPPLSFAHKMATFPSLTTLPFPHSNLKARQKLWVSVSIVYSLPLLEWFFHHSSKICRRMEIN